MKLILLVAATLAWGPVVRPQSETGGAPSGASDLGATIKRIDDTHVVVVARDARMWDHVAAGFQTTRFVPEMRDGKPIGFRLFAITPESVPGRLGFRNGDVLRAVNGIPLDAPDTALQAYTKARAADLLRLDVDRNGARVTLEVKIVAAASTAALAPTGPSGAVDVGGAVDPATLPIRKLGDRHFAIKRDFAARALDATQISRAARIVPQVEDGMTVGVRLFSIRPGSLPAALGFLNGDLVEQVNGILVNNADNVLALYGKLRTIDRVEFVVRRLGRPLTIALDVVD
jgi:type II secretory pathway component PulC